jgi:hypothetical protein
MKQLVSALDTDPDARREFADLARSFVSREAANDEDGSDTFYELDGEELFHRLSAPALPNAPTPAGLGGAADIGVGGGEADIDGGAANLLSLFGGLWKGAKQLLNFTTYYQMKARAGKIGSTGLNDVLHRLSNEQPNLKLHLMGHSFGARLVTAATAGDGAHQPLQIDTLSLLQAAFSHYGFAEHYDGTQDGFFRDVVKGKHVKGPMVISFTKNDLAVGLAYPIASRIIGQMAAAIGDRNDPYGGLGRNGAQKTPEANDGTLVAANAPYSFDTGKVYNLNADALIMNHSDIVKDEVAHALASAIAST